MTSGVSRWQHDFKSLASMYRDMDETTRERVVRLGTIATKRGRDGDVKRGQSSFGIRPSRVRKFARRAHRNLAAQRALDPAHSSIAAEALSRKLGPHLALKSLVTAARSKRKRSATSRTSIQRELDGEMGEGTEVHGWGSGVLP